MEAGPGRQSWSAGTSLVAEREEAVRAALGGTHLPWDVRLPDASSYRCELTWQTLASGTVVECRSDPVRGRRTPAELRRTDGDTIAVLLVLEGRERVRQEGVAVELGPGDALLWTSAAAAEFEVLEALHKLTLLLPADRVAALRPRERIGPTPLWAGNPAVRLLTGHLQTLAAVAPDLTHLDGELALDVALDLLVNAVKPTEPSSAATSARHALLDRALAVIGSELADPDLTPATLAVRLGITPRYLHMVFSGTGETVAAHIRRRRLARVRAELADPSRHDDTLTAIAFRWGFGDSGQLSRQFRAEHGMSPTQFRAHRRLPRHPAGSAGATGGVGHRTGVVGPSPIGPGHLTPSDHGAPVDGFLP